jgi:hypothetical protein
MNGRPRQSRRTRDDAHAAIAKVAGFCRRPLSPSPLIQFWRHGLVFAPQPDDCRWLLHTGVMTESRRQYKNYL